MSLDAAAKKDKRRSGEFLRLSPTIVGAAVVVCVGSLALAYYTCGGSGSKPTAVGDVAVGRSRRASAEECQPFVDAATVGAGAPIPAPASSSANIPMGVALANSFPKEMFNLQHIRVAPGVEDWRLCYPGKDATNPVCPVADFFVVNQQDSSTDRVVDWLQSAEEHVFDLVSAVISTKLPSGCLRSSGPCLTTAGDFSAAERESGRVMFLDIGANHAFYSLFATGAAPFLTVYAFEPQPHCAAFIQVAIEASGFRERMMVLNNLAGTTALAAPAAAGAADAAAPSAVRGKKGKKAKKRAAAAAAAAAAGASSPASGGAHYGRFYVPPKSAASVMVPRRTGCRGTWPTLLPNELAAVKDTFRDFPEAMTEVPVTYVDPGALVPAGHSVLFAKVDVEGFEQEVLDSLAPLLEAKRVYNILMELNKPQKLRRLGRDPNDLQDAVVVEWVTMMIRRLQGYGYTIVPQWGGYKTQPVLQPDDAVVKEFAKSGWNSVDILAYIPPPAAED